MPEALTTLVDAINSKVGPYLLTFAAVGTLTMAIIQTIKELTPARAWFHRRELKRWLARGLPTAARAGADDDTKKDQGGPGAAAPDDVDRLTLANPLSRESTDEAAPDCGLDACRRQLVELATAGDAAALYALEIEKLAGQLGTAAAIVVDFPQGYPALLRCLARNAHPMDLEELVEGSTPTEHPPDADQALKEAVNRQLGRKVRVTHQIQRNIDGFQISTAYRWGWVLQLCSFGLSFVIAVVALTSSLTGKGFESRTFVSALPVALAAGFLAPIARDLLAFIQKR